MKTILLLHVEFSVIFAIYYGFTRVAIQGLLKKASFGMKYAAIKVIPLLCLLTLCVDFWFGDIRTPFTSMELNVLGDLTSKVELAFRSNGGRTFMALFVNCLFMIWITGVFLLLIKYGITYCCFRSAYENRKCRTAEILNEMLADCVKQCGMKNRVNIYYSDRATTPFICGIFKSRIMIPISMSEHLKPIILHELTHCVQHDLLVKTGTELLNIIQWFNPLLYCYARDLEQFCELACDENVSRLLTFEERKDYAHEILNNARTCKSSAFLATFSSNKIYKNRLEHLLYPTAGEHGKGKALLLLGAILLVSGGSLLLQTMNQDFIMLNEASQTKVIRVNYLHGEEEEEFYYEEYKEDVWWRGTLEAGDRRKISDKLTEVTFSGELYACEE